MSSGWALVPDGCTTIIREDSQFDVVVLLLRSSLEHVERSALGHVQYRPELQLPLHREVLDGGVVLINTGKRNVENGDLQGGFVETTSRLTAVPF